MKFIILYFLFVSSIFGGTVDKIPLSRESCCEVITTDGNFYYEDKVYDSPHFSAPYASCMYWEHDSALNTYIEYMPICNSEPSLYDRSEDYALFDDEGNIIKEPIYPLDENGTNYPLGVGIVPNYDDNNAPYLTLAQDEIIDFIKYNNVDTDLISCENDVCSYNHTTGDEKMAFEYDKDGNLLGAEKAVYANGALKVTDYEQTDEGYIFPIDLNLDSNDLVIDDYLLGALIGAGVIGAGIVIGAGTGVGSLAVGVGAFILTVDGILTAVKDNDIPPTVPIYLPTDFVMDSKESVNESITNDDFSPNDNDSGEISTVNPDGSSTVLTVDDDGNPKELTEVTAVTEVTKIDDDNYDVKVHTNTNNSNIYVNKNDDDTYDIVTDSGNTYTYDPTTKIIKSIGTINNIDNTITDLIDDGVVNGSNDVGADPTHTDSVVDDCLKYNNCDELFTDSNIIGDGDSNTTGDGDSNTTGDGDTSTDGDTFVDGTDTSLYCQELYNRCIIDKDDEACLLHTQYCQSTKTDDDNNCPYYKNLCDNGNYSYCLKYNQECISDNNETNQSFNTYFNNNNYEHEIINFNNYIVSTYNLKTSFESFNKITESSSSLTSSSITEMNNNLTDIKNNLSDSDSSLISKIDNDGTSSGLISTYTDFYSNTSDMFGSFDSMLSASLDQINNSEFSTYSINEDDNSCPKIYDMTAFHMQDITLDLCKEFTRYKPFVYFITYVFFTLVLTMFTVFKLVRFMKHNFNKKEEIQ